MSTDPQESWDQEDALQAARKLCDLSRRVRSLRQEEAAARQQAERAATRQQAAALDLERLLRSATDTLSPTLAPELLRQVQQLGAVQDDIEVERLRTRQELVRARERRQQAQAELRAAIHAQRQSYPLFDRKGKS